ncbi:MAG TPA: tRNA lysidine(34) synthetase TilS [Halioglobus sp.]
MLTFTDLDSQLNELLAAPHWYVGYSGGVDSTALLHVLHSWCAANPESPPLSALHINHGLQAAAGDWQRHCESVCGTLQLPFISLTVDVHAKGRGEAAARAARYGAFERQLPAGAVLFLAHHLDDQVETFFLRLLRGAGVEGLAAMPRRRTLGEGLLVRPLLEYRRRDIEQYAVHHRLAYVEDPSNSNTAMDRNFLRSEVLPLLASRWPRYRQSVARTRRHMAAAAVVMADELGVPETVHSVMGDRGLLLTPLMGGPVEVAATRLRAWLRAQGFLVPDSAVLAEFLRQLREAAPDATPRLSCGSCTLQRYRDGVYLWPDFACPPPTQSLVLAPGASCEVPGVGTVSLRHAVGEGVWLAPGEQPTLSWRRGGERCRLPGRTGSRSLKTLLQEWDIPPWWRDRVPLLYLEDELLAVGDVVRCESSRRRTAAECDGQLWSLHWEPLVSTRAD